MQSLKNRHVVQEESGIDIRRPSSQSGITKEYLLTLILSIAYELLSSLRDKLEKGQKAEGSKRRSSRRHKPNRQPPRSGSGSLHRSKLYIQKSRMNSMVELFKTIENFIKMIEIAGKTSYTISIPQQETVNCEFIVKKFTTNLM